MTPMARLVGIDEAGLGPVVGPLVVTATSFEVPEELLTADLWRVLAGAVGRRPADGAPIAIADSKLLYHGARSPGGIGHLERGVLAALGCLGPLPADLAQLRSLLTALDDAAEGEPWEAGPPPAVPAAIAAAELEQGVAVLRSALAAAGLRLTAVRADEVRPARLNRLLAVHDTKADVVFDVVAGLLAPVLAEPGFAVVHVDRLGGRRHYRELLERLPGVRWVWILGEARDCSSYRLETDHGAVEIHFEVGGDGLRLPVALSSMVGKYLRELAMACFNRYWCEQLPGLAPTAGYPTDGDRFLAAIEPVRRRLGIDPRVLRRNR